MAVEWEHQHERIKRGQLYFLTHQDSEVFSGYGLTTQDGRNDRLVGIVMVDRPHPADPAWLEDMAKHYGGVQLVAMTRNGERGIVTRMWIAPDSLSLLKRLSHPLTAELTHALTPLLSAPPAPLLRLHWGEQQKLWHSTFGR